jgi:hypothetical protein
MISRRVSSRRAFGSRSDGATPICPATKWAIATGGVLHRGIARPGWRIAHDWSAAPSRFADERLAARCSGRLRRETPPRRTASPSARYACRSAFSLPDAKQDTG